MDSGIVKDKGFCQYPLDQIYFYLTKGCNLNCRHCWIAPDYMGESSASVFLDLELFKSIVRQAKPLGMSKVKLTGGEPLLHPQIEQIIDFIKEEDISLGLETNGVLCTETIAEKIKACKKTFVSVSLDGVDADTHDWMRGVRGSFDAAISGIKKIVNAGIRPQIIMTLVRRNKDQVKALVCLAEGLGAGSVKFNMVEPTARGEVMHKNGEALSLEELIDLGRWIDEELSEQTVLNLFYTSPVAFRSLSRMFNPKGDGCSTCGIFSILGVLADGFYALCGIGETVPELIFGDAAKDPLSEVWNNSNMLCQLRQGLPSRLEGICSECLMKNICLGSCIAQNYYRRRNLWSPFWFCEEAEKRGFFPASRKRKEVHVS